MNLWGLFQKDKISNVEPMDAIFCSLIVANKGQAALRRLFS